MQLREEAAKSAHRAYLGFGKYSIELTSEFKFKQFSWSKTSQQKKVVMHNTSLIDSIVARLLKNDFGLISTFINCCTTLHIHNKNEYNKNTYRADPYFYKKPWMDWCLSSWENDSDDETKLYPCRIYMFIDTKDMEFTSDIDKRCRYWAVIKSSENDTRNTRELKNKNCLLMKTYDADIYVRIIPCHTIIKPVFVVPDIINISRNSNNKTFESKQIIMINDYDKWSDIFIQNKWL